MALSRVYLVIHQMVLPWNGKVTVQQGFNKLFIEHAIRFTKDKVCG